jgi:NADPH:quinone reductase-like Zn-dependent oxidoreductase
MSGRLETWDLWLPGPGASGLPFARSRVNPDDTGDRVLVHAAPQRLQVVVSDAAGQVVARGDGLERHQPGPMSYLVRRGAIITLEDGWPTQSDIGRVVLLPGGEAGILKSWWNADDHKEWRWQIEFYNQIRG